MTAGSSQASVPTVSEIARRFPQWLRTHLFAALISAVIGGVFGYVWNVWLIAVRYGGDSKVPGGAPATGDGNFFEGAVFWGVAGAVLFGVGSYWHAVGTQRFFSDLRGLPRALAALISGDRAARVHLLWGAAASMLVAVILAPSLGAVLAIGLLVAAPGVLGSIIANFVGRIWSKLVETFAPTRRHAVTGVTGVTVGLLGSATALLVAAVIPSVVIKLILVLVLAGAALAISRIGPPPAASMLLFAAIPILAWLTDPVLAFADDGGWQECRYLNEPWLSCPGTPAVLGHAGVGGVAAAVGALGGTFLGAVAGASGNGGPGGGPQQTPSPDRPDGDQATGTQGVSPTGLATGPPGVGPATGPPAVPTGTVVDSRVISGDDARRTLWAATHPPNQPYDPKAPLRAPTGGFPPGISGGGFTTRPDGTIDPDKPIALTVDWHHPAAPPTDQWVTPPKQGFDGNRLAATLKQDFGMPTQTVTGPDGKTYVKVPDNLPANVAGSAHGTKNIGGQKVFDPDSPIHISHWPKPPPPPLKLKLSKSKLSKPKLPKPKVPKPKLPQPKPPQPKPPTPTPTPAPTPTPTPTPPTPTPAPTPTPTPTPPTPTPTRTPAPTAAPTPTPTPPTDDEMIKAARLAQLRDQVEKSEAAASTYGRQAWGFDALDLLRDVGVNIACNFLPQGLLCNCAYSTIKNLISSARGEQGVGLTIWHLARDNGLNVLFGWKRFPGGAATSGIPAKVANGVGNSLAGKGADMAEE